MNIDVAGSAGRGKAFRQRIKLDYGGIDVEDILSGAQFLKAQPFVDGDRLGLWGSSYGGLMTAKSLFTKPGVFKAGIAGAPATNVRHAPTGEMRVMQRPQEHAAVYDRASAYRFAEGLETPWMIIHGMRDRIVLFRDSVALVSASMVLGKDVEFVVLPDSEHGWDTEGLDQGRSRTRRWPPSSSETSARRRVSARAGRAIGPAANPAPDGTTASASISTRYSRPDEAASTSVLAGWMWPKRSPCARATASQCAMSETKTRVRTTSRNRPPSDCSAPSILSMTKCVCAAAIGAAEQRRCRASPSCPTRACACRRARRAEKPAIGSHGVPLRHCSASRSASGAPRRAPGTSRGGD